MKFNDFCMILKLGWISNIFQDRRSPVHESMKKRLSFEIWYLLLISWNIQIIHDSVDCVITWTFLSKATFIEANVFENIFSDTITTLVQKGMGPKFKRIARAWIANDPNHFCHLLLIRVMSHEHYVISNHWYLHCLLYCVFSCTSTKITKLRVTGSLWADPSVTDPVKRASNVENVSISRRCIPKLVQSWYSLLDIICEYRFATTWH